MESNIYFNHSNEQLNSRELNKRFDRRLIISFLNSNKKKLSKSKDKDFYEILIDLIEKKLLHVHCSNIDREKISLLNKKKYKSLLNSNNSVFIESKDNLLFISV